MNKSLSRRQRRAKKTRQKIRSLDVARLSIGISLRHVYAQIFSADGSKVLAHASSLDKEILSALTKKSVVNKENAAVIGQHIAKRAVAAGITKVAFDRSGHKYHGRVKALADAARENGLIF